MLALHIVVNQSCLITHNKKVLQFLFKNFLLFSGRVESRDNICMIKKQKTYWQKPHM